MSTEFIKYAFSAGEISPKLYGRSDLEQYDLGLAQSRNWFVDYRGGLSTRPGTEFLDYIKLGEYPNKFVEFQFSPDISNTYLLVFGDHYVRFVQDGAYVLEAPVSITAVSAANPGVFTRIAHGLQTGDWVKLFNMNGMDHLNGTSYIVTRINGNTFRLTHPMGYDVNTTPFAYTGGGSFARVYEVATPYAWSDLAQLRADQRRDLLRLTHPNFSIRNLIRYDHADWVLEEEVIGGTLGVPQISNVLASGSGTASTGYCVAAIHEGNQESYPSYPNFASAIVNFTTTAGQVRVEWDPVPGAIGYIVYRTRVVSQDHVDPGAEMGYIGSTKSTFFVDSNIIPDFTKGPYQGYNPFANSAIESINIDNPGAGYEDIALINASGFGGSGAGFRGYALSSIGGTITSYVIVDHGYGYLAPVTLTVDPPPGPGTTAELSANLSPVSGLAPSISAIFQQRQMYAASLENPLTLWASRPRPNYSSFNTSARVNDGDSYEYEIDSAQVAPILHMIPARGGLLLMSEAGIWLLSGGGQGQAVTASNALADPQVFNGVSKIKPLFVASEILYAEGNETAIRLLSYNDFSKVYAGADQTILASHLFEDYRLVNWDYADNPHKIVFGVREDGALLMFTIVKEEKVAGWTWGSTQGYFKDVISIQENKIDRVYFKVQRGDKFFLERLASRSFTNVEDSWCVDSGVTSTLNEVTTNILAISEEVEPPFTTYREVTIYTEYPQFTGMEGYWLRAAGGVFVIDTVLSPTQAIARVVCSATDILPETGEVILQTVFTLDEPRLLFGGLDHLNGRQVTVQADGNDLGLHTVVAGLITLAIPATKVTAGLGYECVAQTLPPASTQVPIEARRKRILGVGVRFNESRGLLQGNSLLPAALYPVKARTTEGYGFPTELVNGMRYTQLSTTWEEDASLYFVQKSPLPATILGCVPDAEIGDDPN